jgi:uncharacterized protein
MKDKILQVAIKAIGESGLERSIDLGPEWFSRWREEEPQLEFASAAVNGSVRLGKHGRDILVRGHLQGHLQLACSRCLEEAEELSAPDLDLDYYSGEVLDLEAILREQIILLVPLKPLCTEDCQGICPRCGAVLNREACTCK